MRPGAGLLLALLSACPPPEASAAALRIRAVSLPSALTLSAALPAPAVSLNALRLPSPLPAPLVSVEAGVFSPKAAPAASPAVPSAGDSLKAAAKFSPTFAGSRRVWDSSDFSAPKEAAPVSVEAPAPETASRWKLMKAATKRDFRALKKSAVELKHDLVLPRSWKHVKEDGASVGRFFLRLKQLGWKVIGAVVAYYLVRDTLLYIVIPYLLLRGAGGV